MRHYRRLAREERYQIKALKDSGLSVRKMAKVLGRSASTVSRELRRNRSEKYIPRWAHEMAQNRRAQIGPPRCITLITETWVRQRLEQQWSPEQISGRLGLMGTPISHETIYQYIYRDFKAGGTLYTNLRRRRRWRRSRTATRNFKKLGKRSYQNWIRYRPSIVEKRTRIGDFERDTVLGKFRGPLLLTLVDRVTRLTRLEKLAAVNAMLTHRATVKLLKTLPVETITNDNGPEFAFYDLTEKELQANVYFNDPYCAWQRGTNENTNGLIRQYYPKGTDFTKVRDRDLKEIETKLNNRPRKCLGYKTPLEVHKLLSRGVALST
jgi:transposase, IS30 family